jgi:hypothetical protein
VGSESYQVPALIYEAGPFEVCEIAQIVASFFHDLSRQRASSKTETHWVEDTPENFLRVRELRRLFLDMRFVHIYRDPRDVVASYRHHLWGGDNLETIAQRVAGMLSKWLSIRAELDPDDYLEVGVEELAANPGPGLERICDYIGLPMTIDLTQIPLDRDKVHAGRWKQELTQDEAESIKSHLEPLVQAFGYGD